MRLARLLVCRLLFAIARYAMAATEAILRDDAGR
jgi:hypothetical protein